MLIPQGVGNEPAGRQGGRQVSLAELRRSLARPSAMSDVHRQRLLDLARRVQALGDEYAGVGLSEHALEALNSGAGVP